MVKVPLCPSCGHPIVSDEIGVVLTPLQRRIFNLVKRAGVAGVSCQEVMAIVYANVRGGGPVSANIVSVVCNQMNKRLEQFSIAIKGIRGRGGTIALCRLQSGRWVRASNEKEDHHAAE